MGPNETISGIEVKTAFFPLAFLLFMCTPRIEIDGREYKKYWGTHFFEVLPGRHQVTVFFPYLLARRCGENSITVNTEPGKVTRVKYYMPPWMLMKGLIKVIS